MADEFYEYNRSFRIYFILGIIFAIIWVYMDSSGVLSEPTYLNMEIKNKYDREFSKDDLTNPEIFNNDEFIDYILSNYTRKWYHIHAPDPRYWRIGYLNLAKEIVENDKNFRFRLGECFFTENYYGGAQIRIIDVITNKSYDINRDHHRDYIIRPVNETWSNRRIAKTEGDLKTFFELVTLKRSAKS